VDLYLRRSCSYLHRRTSGRVRNPERLASVVEIVRRAYNFIRPHARLQLGSRARTPAMVAGIFDRVLSWRSVFAWPAPPPKAAVVLARADPSHFVSQPGLRDVAEGSAEAIPTTQR
jgi:hypothetical protein